MRADLRSALAALVLVVVAGCYDLNKRPVVELGDAQAIPWVVGEWEFPKNRQIVVFAGDHPNEYRFREISGKSVVTGTFRAVSLGGGYYLVQVITDGGEVSVLYYRRDPDGQVAELDVRDNVFDLAKQFGVTIEEDEEILMYFLDGPPARVRAFLLAHKPEHLKGP